jgi:hypothetical protein
MARVRDYYGTDISSYAAVVIEAVKTLIKE